MMRWFSSIVALTLLSIATTNAYATELVVGFIERPPYIYSNADGSIRGKFGQQLEDVFFQSRVNAKLRSFDATELKSFFGHNQLDAFIATKTLVNQPDKFHFSQDPLVVLRFYAYYLKSSEPVEKISDLKNTKVVLPLPLSRLRGELKEWLSTQENNIDVVGHSLQFDDQINLLEAGDVDYVITHIDQNNQAMNFSKKLKTDHLQVNNIFNLPMYLVVRKSVEGSKDMMQRINQHIRRIR